MTVTSKPTTSDTNSTVLSGPSTNPTSKENTVSHVHAMSPTNSNPLDGVIEAMKSIQSEADRWRLAEALRVMVPSGVKGFEKVIEEASKEGVLGKLTINTMRLYRDTAVRWPEGQRIDKVSFSAHRTAMTLPSIGDASKLLEDLAKTMGPDKVTVQSVRKAIAAKQGGGTSSSKSSGVTTTQVQPTAPKVGTYTEVLIDIKQGSPKLIAAVPATTSLNDLDQLQAGLQKAIAHVEQLRAKAARKAATPVKGSPTKTGAEIEAADRAAARRGSPGAKKAAAKPRAKAKAGDLRGL